MKKSPIIMGVLNVTPDSFSDGGLFNTLDAAFIRARQMVAQGADIIDVGGESTRPGSTGVSISEEIGRVIPVVEKIVSELSVDVSIDTTKPEVALMALKAGAVMVNDVSMLRHGNELAESVASRGAKLMLMHSRKTPVDMQKQIQYDNVVHDVRSELLSAVEKAIASGVKKENIWLDPGIGFAKTAQQNVDLIRGLREIVSTGYPVMVGPSRKTFIGEITGAAKDERQGGTAAAVSISIYNGAQGVRVHDVQLMKQAAIVSSACCKSVSFDD